MERGLEFRLIHVSFLNETLGIKLSLSIAKRKLTIKLYSYPPKWLKTSERSCLHESFLRELLLYFNYINNFTHLKKPDLNFLSLYDLNFLAL